MVQKEFNRARVSFLRASSNMYLIVGSSDLLSSSFGSTDSSKEKSTYMLGSQGEPPIAKAHTIFHHPKVVILLIVQKVFHERSHPSYTYSGLGIGPIAC